MIQTSVYSEAEQDRRARSQLEQRNRRTAQPFYRPNNNFPFKIDSSLLAYFNQMIENFRFHRFYFYSGSTLLNYTTCIDVCNKKGRNLQRVDDFEQIRDIMADQKLFRQIGNRTESEEPYLTYFIGIWVQSCEGKKPLFGTHR